jgi:hypothetical protein
MPRGVPPKDRRGKRAMDDEPHLSISRLVIFAGERVSLVDRLRITAAIRVTLL